MSIKTLLLEDELETRIWFEARLAECARVRLVASVGTLAAARRAIASFAISNLRGQIHIAAPSFRPTRRLKGSWFGSQPDLHANNNLQGAPQ